MQSIKTDQAARDYINNLHPGSTVTIKCITKDKYGRTMAEVSKEHINIQEQLVDKGFARIYERYASQCRLAKSKNEASQYGYCPRNRC